MNTEGNTNVHISRTMTVVTAATSVSAQSNSTCSSIFRAYGWHMGDDETCSNGQDTDDIQRDDTSSIKAEADIGEEHSVSSLNEEKGLEEFSPEDCTQTAPFSDFERDLFYQNPILDAIDHGDALDYTLDALSSRYRDALHERTFMIGSVLDGGTCGNEASFALSVQLPEEVGPPITATQNNRWHKILGNIRESIGFGISKIRAARPRVSVSWRARRRIRRVWIKAIAIGISLFYKMKQSLCWGRFFYYDEEAAKGLLGESHRLTSFKEWQGVRPVDCEEALV